MREGHAHKAVERGGRRVRRLHLEQKATDVAHDREGDLVRVGQAGEEFLERTVAQILQRQRGEI
jgi:hypothetical protein